MEVILLQGFILYYVASPWHAPKGLSGQRFNDADIPGHPLQFEVKVSDYVNICDTSQQKVPYVGQACSEILSKIDCKKQRQ